MTTRVAWILLFAASIVTACSYSLPNVIEANICGNGATEGDEQGDDGNDIEGDACDSNCTIPTCGNGILSAGEECDDGNAMTGDLCNATCQVTICGDGKIQPGEECDDNNLDIGDTCDLNCTLPRCGNAVQGTNEVCDDGNVDNGDACNSSCTLKNQSSIFVGTLEVPGIEDGFGELAQLSDRPIMQIHDGTMFITSTNTVRTVDLITREVKTIAGMGGTSGYFDDLTGAAARFGDLEGIATDGTTLWVSDPDNHVLRAISLMDPAHPVTTVAGTYAPWNVVLESKEGKGLAAQFDDLRGLVYYDGLLYMLDNAASILQTFDPMSAEVKTVAGSAYKPGFADGKGANAQFIGPRLLTSNGNGLLYISDFDGNRIRVFDTATQEVTTLAGSGDCNELGGIGTSAQLYGPRGIATDGSNVYFTQPLPNTIRQVVVATKQVTTLSGTAQDCTAACNCTLGVGGYAEGIGKAAVWNAPWGIAFDPSSKSLFVSDSENFVIRRIQ